MNKSNQMKMKIGYMDSSNSRFSKEILQDVYENEMLILEELEYSEGVRNVKKGDIEAFLIMPADLEERAFKGDLKKIIKLIYLSENSLAPMIGEIILGELLEQISIVTALNYFDSALEERVDKDDLLEEAYLYAQDLSRDTKSNYYVFVDIFSSEPDRELYTSGFDDSLIYKQMILGMMLIFLSFFIAFTSISIVKENENQINRRIRITKLTRTEIFFGDFLSLCCPSILLSLPCAFILAMNSSDFLYSLYSFCIILIPYILVFSSMILFLSKWVKTVSSYIILGAVLILIMGIISGCFFNIDLTNHWIKRIAYLTPSYHALKELLNIFIYGASLELKSYFLYCTTMILLFFGLDMGLTSFGLLDNKDYSRV